VQIGNGVEKNVVIKKVWNCNARKAALKQIVFDGQKLAWYVSTPSNLCSKQRLISHTHTGR
jgi:eukaryotic translation initiation factor 2C